MNFSKLITIIIIIIIIYISIYIFKFTLDPKPAFLSSLSSVSRFDGQLRGRFLHDHSYLKELSKPMDHTKLSWFKSRIVLTQSLSIEFYFCSILNY